VSAERTYRLNPPDRTGWILGLGGTQVVVLGIAVVVAVLGLSFGVPLVVAMVVVGAAAILSLGRVAGRPVVEWVAPVWRWVRNARRSKPWFAPLTPLDAPPGATPALPPPLDSQVFIAVEGELGVPVGVVQDLGAGTYAATLRVAGRQFALVERAEQDSLLALWGDALAAFCREGSPVTAVRWSEWAAPAGMEEQHAYLAEHSIDDPADPVVASYRQMLRTAAPVATRHEVLVTVVVSAGGVRVAGRHGGDRQAAATETLLGELYLLKRRLEAAGLVVSDPLSGPQLARAVRVRLDPTVIATLDRRGRSLGDRAGLVAPADGGPLAASPPAWTHWRIDGSYHRSFYFREWPRYDVGPSWMSDLLLYGGAVRTVAMCYQPVAPRISHRAIARQAAKLESDAEHRRKTGFRVGAHHRRAAQAVDDREEELVAGFAELEYVGLVSIAAPDPDTLDRACAELTQLSAGCGIELRPLDGRHDAGVAACLPLARGLAPKLVSP